RPRLRALLRGRLPALDLLTAVLLARGAAGDVRGATVLGETCGVGPRGLGRPPAGGAGSRGGALGGDRGGRVTDLRGVAAGEGGPDRAEHRDGDRSADGGPPDGRTQGCGTATAAPRRPVPGRVARRAPVTSSFQRRQPPRGVAAGGGTHRGADSPLSCRDLNGRAPTAPPPGRRRGWRAGRRGGSPPSLVDRRSHVRALEQVRHEC